MSLAPDASFLVVCSRSLSMRIYALQPSDSDNTIETKLVRTLKPHTAPVVVAAVDASSTLLATGGADGVVKVWDIRGGFTTHTFHGHSGVISALHFFQVEVSSADSKQKSRKRKSRSGRDDDEAMEDAPDSTIGFRLASGGEDGKIRVWDLHKRKSVATLESHVSVVRSLDFSSQQGLLLSASRDKTVIAWDSKGWQPKSTVPILETVERAGFVANGTVFYTGGENCRIRIWDLAGNERTQEQEPGVETEAILDVLYFTSLPFLVSVHADQTLVLHSLEPLFSSSDAIIPPLPILRRISGNHDEVIDLAYIGKDKSLLALATNEEDIRLISLASSQYPSDPTTAPYFGADVGLLTGHTDIVITLSTDWSGHWLATGAKDNTAKLWRLDPENRSFECYATFTGHAESISAVALPHAVPPQNSAAYNKPLDYPPAFLITGSQDKTIKRWDISALKSSTEAKAVRATYTRKAHDKDINAIAVSPSNCTSGATVFASASQDRTVKIWDLESGESIGVLRGHKRGVWSVAFAPPGTPTISGETGNASGNKGMVVTGSGDKTVKIWTLNDYSCLRTLEGHTNSVLKALWLPNPSEAEKRKGGRGIQVASAAGDGLVKVWDVTSGECAATLDNHIDRVWALAVKPAPPTLPKTKKASTSGQEDEDEDEEDEEEHSPPLELVSGSADSTLTFWHDTTLQTSHASASRATARIEQDQDLQNHIRAANYREAITLALQLNHPKRLLDLFVRVLETKDEERDQGSLMGKKGVDDVLASLGDDQLWTLLLRCRDWNANARTARVAQRVLYALFRLYPKEKFVSLRRRRARPAPTEDEEGEDGGEVKKRKERNENVRDVLDGLKAYTERHYQRLEKMAEERWVLLWTLQQMDETSGVEGGGVGLIAA